MMQTARATRPAAILPLLALAAGLATTAATATEPLRVRGDALAPDGAIAAGPIELRGHEEPTTAPVLVLEAPPVEGDLFAIAGRVRTESVEGKGYLEMWTVFPDGSRYFSRTLAAAGPLARLTGSSPERPFVLPFQSSADAPPPARLELNLVLPGPGRVVLSDLRFQARADLAGAVAVPGAWWSDRTAGYVGAALGGALGLAGMVAGVLLGLRAAPGIVRGLLNAVLMVGLVGLALGGTALALGQPYGVWYPPVLVGVIGVPMALFLRRDVRRRYEPDPAPASAPGLG